MAFDPAKHHIGLGVAGELQDGFLLTGGYQKSRQRSHHGSEFGGGNDQIAPVPSLSRWTQDSFLGGQYGYNWGEDNQQFSRARGFVPSQLGDSLRTVPPLTEWTHDPFSQPTWNPLLFFSYGNLLHTLFGAPLNTVNGGAHSIHEIDTGDDAVAPISLSEDVVIERACVDYSNDCIWYYRRPNTATRRMTAVSLTTGAVLGLINFTGGPGGAHCYGMVAWDGFIYSQWSSKYNLWRADPADDFSTLTWTNLGPLDGAWRDAVLYNGLLYILLSDGQHRTNLVSFDGTDALPVTDFPFNFDGRCITTYGGRLFVGGSGVGLTGADQYAQLYEVSASSVRLVRTFEPESIITGGDTPTTFDKMLVHEGLLFLGGDSPQILAYDITTDAFYGGPDLGAPPDNTLHVVGLTSSRNYLTALVRDASDEHLIYRLASSAGDVPSGYTADFETSDFAPEPSVRKRWSMFHVHTRYGAVDQIEYSTDGGSSYTVVDHTSMMEGDFWHNEADLSDIPLSTRVRFRVTFDRGTDVTTFTELVATTLLFAFVGSGRRAWQFTVNLSEHIEALDGTKLTQDISTLAALFEDFALNETQLIFTDVNGVEHNVILDDVVEHQPIVGPRLPAHGRPEALYQLTLIEV